MATSVKLTDFKGIFQPLPRAVNRTQLPFAAYRIKSSMTGIVANVSHMKGKRPRACFPDSVD
jgi:hypothetical protein